MNLTHLYASNNSIYDFSPEVFSNLTTIETIDVRNNMIDSVESDFFNRIKTGLKLFIAGKYELLGFFS